MGTKSFNPANSVDTKQHPSFPFGCLSKVPPLALLGILLCGFMGGLIVFQNANNFGIRTGEFQNYTISPGFMHFEDGKRAWNIQYEKKTNSLFTGSVRHISPIRMNEFSLLTHDILVTTGDYADPDLVRTNVTNHHFSWQSLNGENPGGSIHLLHTVPKNETIYQQLLAIRDGDNVSITGWEILRIDSLDSNQRPVMWWQDDGCNTLLVDGVEVNK